MNIIAVDDERRALNRTQKAILKNVPDANVTLFMSANEVLEYARDTRIDIAFLDIEMAEMSGLILAKKLKDIHGDTNIIFVTGYSQYGADAFDLRASGYVMKPISAEDVARELENLRNPVAVQGKGVRIQCFGSFEVFVDGIPVSFKRERSREVLAYLVDRQGARASRKEIAAILWGDETYTRSKQLQLGVIINEMKRALQAAGAENIIIQKQGLYAIDETKINCDFYDYDKGIATAVNLYHGEYMVNYTWAEFTAGRLSRQ
ncbi:response regulator [Christensenellaceae bacterium OttesenSCG-928-K19]|nr:response regulator [Christensenellaceae bacterium OttesenSCG-928-K19]